MRTQLRFLQGFDYPSRWFSQPFLALFLAEVILQYKEVDQLPAEERNTVIKVVSVLHRDCKIKARLYSIKKWAQWQGLW